MVEQQENNQSPFIYYGSDRLLKVVVEVNPTFYLTSRFLNCSTLFLKMFHEK